MQELNIFSFNRIEKKIEWLIHRMWIISENGSGNDSEKGKEKFSKFLTKL